MVRGILISVAILLFISGPLSAEPMALFSEEELSQLQHSDDEWVDELFSYRMEEQQKQEEEKTRSHGAQLQKGPDVSILTPTMAGDHYRSLIPLKLLVYLKSTEAPIDIESLEVKGKKGLFTLNITDRIKQFLRQPEAGEEADYVIDAKIPKIGTGKYLIIMSLADMKGNREERQAFLEVVKKTE